MADPFYRSRVRGERAVLAEGLTVSEMLHGLRLVTGVEQRSKIATTSPTRGLDPPLTTAPQQQFGSAIGTCLLAVERGHRPGCRTDPENRTLCAIVGSVAQEPPSCQKRLSPTAFSHTEAFVSIPRPEAW